MTDGFESDTSWNLNLRFPMKRVRELGTRYEPEYLVIAGVVFVLVALLGGGGNGRRFSALLLVQGPRAVVVVRGTFLVALLAALLVKPQREALTEFLQHALLLVLACAMRRILASAGGHVGINVQDGGRLLQPGRMTDQRNRRLGQGMLGRRVTAPRFSVLLVAGPLSGALAGIFKAEFHIQPSVRVGRCAWKDGSTIRRSD